MRAPEEHIPACTQSFIHLLIELMVTPTFHVQVVLDAEQGAGKQRPEVAVPQGSQTRD